MDKKLTIHDVPLEGKRVLIRVDFNVPLKDGKIANTLRIDAALPTIRYALEQKAAGIVLMSHLGRPDGRRKESESLKVIVPELEKNFPDRKVSFLDDCVGETVEQRCAKLENGEIILLENLRFHAEEEGAGVDEAGKKFKPSDEDVKKFRDSLTKLGDVFVNDAFGTAHRAHSSVVGVAPPRAAGFLVKRELEFFSKVLEKPQRPLLAILGGAKVSDKIKLIFNMLDKVDELIICGGMAFTFKKACHGMKIGNSLFDEGGAQTAIEVLEKAKAKGIKVHLPSDWITADKFDKDANTGKATEQEGIPDGWMGLDCGEQSLKDMAEAIARARTILWNGPTGVFEFEKFAAGTRFTADRVAEATANGCVTVIGGGDTATAAANFGVEDKVSHVSTGGGASMELLEGKSLPGVEALSERASL